jgi:hypothetical protein
MKVFPVAHPSLQFGGFATREVFMFSYRRFDRLFAVTDERRPEKEKCDDADALLNVTRMIIKAFEQPIK